MKCVTVYLGTFQIEANQIIIFYHKYTETAVG